MPFRDIPSFAIPALVFVLGLASPQLAQDGDGPNDRAPRTRDAIESVVLAYGTALDTLDADGYAGVFTENARLVVDGTVYNGRAEIRGIVERLKADREAAIREGRPVNALYHVISNTAITLVDPNRAHHQSYWQTIRVGPGNAVVVGAIGEYQDIFVREDGEWRIEERIITPFTAAN